MTKHHYVYSSYEEWGREYIGVRSCNCLPEEDTKYFGSFRDKAFKPTEKTILFACETRKEAAEIEIELHNFFDVAVNPQFANQAKATNTGFDRTGFSGENSPMYGRTGEKHPLYGVPNTEEQKRKKSKAMSGRFVGEKAPHYGKFGALHHSSKAIIAIQPDGTQLHFVSGREAARELEIPRGKLSEYLTSGHVPTRGKFKGWQFIFKNR